MKPEDLFLEIDRIAGKKSRVDGLDVLNVVMSAQSYASAAAAREALAAALNTLKDSGRVRLPVGRHLWDYATRVPIPKWINVIRESTTSVAFDHRNHAWHPALGFLSDQLVVQNVSDFLALDRWLRSIQADEPEVPVKERSWEIFGEEKKLEAMGATKWFGPGRLTLELLRCYIVPHVPVHRTYPDGAPVAVISENEAGFNSLCRLAAASNLFRAVILGNGLAVEKAVSFLSTLIGEQKIAHCVYVGDIDAPGIAIPQRLDVALREAAGKSVDPWLPAYEHMLCGVACDEQPALTDVTWLPRHLHPKAQALIGSGRRVAQESFGWKQMSSWLQVLKAST